MIKFNFTVDETDAESMMISTNQILQFSDNYRWLSNFALVPITQGGIEYRTVEHAYMSRKCTDPRWKEFCKVTTSPAIVKKASRRIPLVTNWEYIKVGVMANCLEQKFAQEPYRTLLIETGDSHIQEGNTWGDTFWGVDIRTGKGDNMLGHLIMGIRANL